MFSCLSPATRPVRTVTSFASPSSLPSPPSRHHHCSHYHPAPSLIRHSQPHTQSPSPSATFPVRHCHRQSFILPPAYPSQHSSSLLPFLSSPKPSLVQHLSRRPFSTTTAVMDMNGEPRAKRKGSPVALGRPPKLLKPELHMGGDETPQNGTIYSVEGEVDSARFPPMSAAPADSPEWQATIEKVVNKVVSIHFCQTCSFDTDLSMSSQATGFVVDAERGYILTNRHVACAGPFWGYCIFDNHEEVRLILHPGCTVLICF
jgi:pro-apoptotic serine protease NMA111